MTEDIPTMAKAITKRKRSPFWMCLVTCSTDKPTEADSLKNTCESGLNPVLYKLCFLNGSPTAPVKKMPKTNIATP
ncbi:hypothetical protein JCM10914A_13750 [Paenibacillus sp. JCM 10914]